MIILPYGGSFENGFGAESTDTTSASLDPSKLEDASQLSYPWSVLSASVASAWKKAECKLSKKDN